MTGNLGKALETSFVAVEKIHVFISTVHFCKKNSVTAGKKRIAVFSKRKVCKHLVYLIKLYSAGKDSDDLSGTVISRAGNIVAHTSVILKIDV